MSIKNTTIHNLEEKEPSKWYYALLFSAFAIQFIDIMYLMAIAFKPD